METIHSCSFDSFLDRMRNPASLDLVRSIKSFIVSFSFNAPIPENDGKRIQDFFQTMEASIRDHPLWAASSDSEIDNALEGLEKYVMTKLHSRTFGSSPEDVKLDAEISDKICLLQTFLRPQHLDIPSVLQNEASWLLAEKELKKINAFKSPREKLLCIINCCRVINNLLLNASTSGDHDLGGADDFLPVLIYVTIKANPPQLHSNLKFIQLYRKQSKLISEAAYYLTNLVSVKAFVADLNAKSLSIEESEFEESMQAARLVNSVPQETSTTFDKISTFGNNLTDPGPSTPVHIKTNLNGEVTMIDTSSLSLIYLNKIVVLIFHIGYSRFRWIEVSEAGELTVDDVERLLNLYKNVVTKYTSLCSTVRHLSLPKTASRAQEENDDFLRGPNGTHRDNTCQGD